MAKSIFNSAGQPVVLGKQLGSGGEGAVFEIIGVEHLVAKLYHKPQDAQKQSKLLHMTHGRAEQLLKYTAWPQDTLHSSKSGPVLGFLMGKVSGMTPVQTLYSPAHRKNEYPERAWDFLLFAARNTAAAFSVLHNHGHVLGDVNHGNAYVSNKATVVLIDTDSYQIRDGSTLHLCEVGVSHYTPPELQGMSFKGITRTANHDNFGLALLIFHLLFGGRHPYAGVPQRDGIGESLEDNIKCLRFAYSKTASQRLLTSPPNSLPLSLLPERLGTMFEVAFTEEGRAGRRPTAKQWLDELDSLRNALKVCPKAKMHVYSNHLQDCPWCALENRGIVYFVTATVYATGNMGAPVNIGQVWSAISSIKAPPELSIPTPGQFKVKHAPLPAGFISSQVRWTLSITLVAVLVILLNNTKTVGGFFVIGGIAGLITIWNWGNAVKKSERLSRSVGYQSAEHQYRNAVDALKREAGPEGFAAKRADLFKLKSEFDQLPVREQKELVGLNSTAEKRQKQKYLERFYIDKSNLHGIGPAKRAALQSFGVETAADVEWSRIRRIKGFGDVLTRTLVDWSKAHERNFRFNPNQAVTPADINAVKMSIQARKQQIEQQLRTGLQQLQQFATQQEQAIRRHTPLLKNAAERLAQAEADLSAVK
jgi:DNA-binding helix-hairpin-helix protein with protein kinase domain